MSPVRPTPFALLALAFVPACYLSHEVGDGAPRACSDAPVGGGCTAWEAAGPPTLLTAPLRGDEGMRAGSAIAGDCGVLVAWGIATLHASGTRLRHETRTADWSGVPTAAVVSHAALAFFPDTGTGPATLARGPGGAALVVGTDTDCIFVPLDVDGHERGASVRAAAGGVCGALAATTSGYSYLATRPLGGSPVMLRTLDSLGAITSTAALVTPPRSSVWSRLVFDDGSFLAYSFSEDFITMRYDSWLQHFDTAGAPLTPEVTLGENAVPVALSPTATGALAAWSTPTSGGLPIRIRPVARSGAAAGETRDAPASGALYGFAIAPTPDGDAILAWTEDHFHERPAWVLRTLALAPDGTPRGAPTTVLTETNTGTPQLLVAPDGVRALALFSDDGGLHAQPLACTRTAP